MFATDQNNILFITVLTLYAKHDVCHSKVKSVIEDMTNSFDAEKDIVSWILSYLR